MSTEVLDVLVVGGGITGVGAALDAVTRGLSVGLIEARDYAAGTSSKSSKLIHGGLRYLEMLDFGLVRESLRERELLLTRLAPHLVKPVPFLWPLTHRGWERVYLGAGLALYDRIGGARSVPPARHLSHRGVRAVAPGLRPDAFVGGVQFYDAQEDDARLVAYVARTAHAHGAALATRVAATGFLREGERVVGVTAHDDETDSGAEHPRPPRAGRHGRLERRAARARGRPLGYAHPPVQGHPHRRAARPDRDGDRRPHADREERALHHPVGAALDPRRHRHGLGARAGASGRDAHRHRVPAREGQRHARASAHARRHRGRLRRPASARRVERERRHDAPQPGSHGRVARARADDDRRRQVHHLSRDGEGSRRRRRAAGWAAVTHGARSDRGGGGVLGPLEPARAARRRGRARRPPHGTSARPLRRPGGRPDRPHRRAPRARRAACGSRRVPRRRGGLRLHARGRPPARGRARTADADLVRDARPRHGRRPGGGGVDGRDARLGRGADRVRASTASAARSQRSCRPRSWRTTRRRTRSSRARCEPGHPRPRPGHVEHALHRLRPRSARARARGRPGHVLVPGARAAWSRTRPSSRARPRTRSRERSPTAALAGATSPPCRSRTRPRPS